MTKEEAKATVTEIAADIVERRGDIDTGQLKRWAAAYTNWRDASSVLDEAELGEAIFQGRMDWLSDLADVHEDAMYEERGEAAYGREDI